MSGGPVRPEPGGASPAPVVERSNEVAEPTVELRVHERLEGHGRAYDGDRLLAEVEYALKDVDEVWRAPVLGGPAEPLAWPRNVFGVVKSPGARVLGEYVGARLTLALADGGVLDFTVAKVLRADAFLIQGLGGVRRVSS